MAAPAPTRDRWLGPLLLRLHFYAAILVAPFILISAASGALYALTPQLEQVVYSDELTAPSDGSPLPLAEQVAAAQEHVGEAAVVTAIRPAAEAGQTTRVMYADDSLGEGESRAIMLDPATAEIRGDLTVYGTSGSLPLRTWVDQLHRTCTWGRWDASTASCPPPGSEWSPQRDWGCGSVVPVVLAGHGTCSCRTSAHAVIAARSPCTPRSAPGCCSALSSSRPRVSPGPGTAEGTSA